jgi:hypothetical protein
MKASFEHTILLGPQAHIHPITPITQPPKPYSQHLCHLQKKIPCKQNPQFSYFLRLADRTIERGQQKTETKKKY